jgi:hypothetical protein
MREEDRLANGSLAALDALRKEWDRRLASLNEEERLHIRQRSLRRLAIETGIVERLYDVDWGLTLTLVAEGFTRDVVERAGGRVDDKTLVTLRAQLDSLGLVLDFVRQNRQLTPSFITELHQAITRTQDTYVVVDSLHRLTETTLPKGTWKTAPNHVLRADNTLLEYAPPEQVASEVDRLILLWDELNRGDVYPLIKAAWLHHRFVQIHPFADGNGRVARALTLLVLEQHHYAPLVVDRWHRTDYINALDSANAGSLRELITLFVRLEAAALTREFEQPLEPAETGVAIDVARTLAAQLAEMKRRRDADIHQRLQPRAIALGGRLSQWFEQKRTELVEVFRAKGVSEVNISADVEMPPTSSKTHWWRRQINQSAQVAGHVADTRTFAGWCSLRIRTERWVLRYVASIHGAGRDPGIVAVTTFAEVEPYPPQEAGESAATPESVTTTVDAFRFVHTESVEDINRRAAELEELLDQGLAVGLAELLKRL